MEGSTHKTSLQAMHNEATYIAEEHSLLHDKDDSRQGWLPRMLDITSQQVIPAGREDSQLSTSPRPEVGSISAPIFKKEETAAFSGCNLRLCQDSLLRLHTDEEEFRQWLYASARRRSRQSSDGAQARDYTGAAIAPTHFSFYLSTLKPLLGFQKLPLQASDHRVFPFGALFLVLVVLWFCLGSRSRYLFRRMHRTLYRPVDTIVQSQPNTIS